MSAAADVPRRLSVSGISTYRYTLAEDVAFWTAHGIERVGVSAAKLADHAADRGLDDAVRLVAQADVDVCNVIGLGRFALADPSTWDDRRAALGDIVEVAAALGAPVAILTTGPARDLDWERAADALADALGNIVSDAREAGVRIAIEHTHSLRADVGFVHTLRDAIELARRLGVGACMEVNACWGERSLDDTIVDGVGDGTISVVQLSDYRIGTTSTPDRVVPGDGDIPLRRIVETLERAGYTGDYDLEIIGPQIEDEGYPAAIARSLGYLEGLLADL